MPQPNMNQMLQKVQKMQADMAAAQEALRHEVIDVSAGGGTVKIQITGELVVKRIEVSPDAIDPEDPELLGEVLTAAVNQAIVQAQEIAAKKMEAASGDLGAMGKNLGLPF
ncbi:MAG: YbaB/EbfC family nucleoid-associated protein [Solirubrobacteraceae bacterium]|nr:YbaB/EbfC family nucleoid-associated protein [Solirubrobacteraceae bacterium]